MFFIVEKFDLANYTGVDKSKIVGMLNLISSVAWSVHVLIIISLSIQYQKELLNFWPSSSNMTSYGVPKEGQNTFLL